MTNFAKVVIDLPLDTSQEQDTFFYYKIPKDLEDFIKTGMIVKIPFGNQDTFGYVIDTEENEPQNTTFKIKEIYEVIYEKEIWHEKYLKFAKWLSEYYFTNLGTVLSASIIAQIIDTTSTELELNKDFKNLNLLSADQLFIINKFLNSRKKSLTYRYLIQNSKFSKQKFYHLITQLKHKEILLIKKNKTAKRQVKNKSTENNLPIEKEENRPEHILNNDQANAFLKISDSIEKNKSDSFLLHGITGSGKTEVYLRLIEETLKKNKTVIYLVPEIYLLPQVYQRLINKFDKSSIIIWHSSLTAKDRYNNFEKIINDKINSTNEIKIILGARSASLVPLENLGLIIIDEAHDGSYKQASPAPRYDAIKVSLKRAETENAVVVLGSATPNITEYHNISKHNLLSLPNRIDNVSMPEVEIIDLKDEVKKQTKSIISEKLKLKINQALENKEQVLLLLNRRGYASHVFCRACGFIQYCKNCSVPQVFHKNLNQVICHHCGYSQSFSMNMQCPDCKSPHFKYFGYGIEQLEEDVKNQFPNAKTLRIDSEQLKGKNKYIDLWQDFASGKSDILIGTQIIAKGLDLPNLTVVGVIFADTMFNFPDYISHERAFQLLTQVTGRAGRGNKAGKVFIQTYQPELPMFKYIKEHDYNGFYENEIRQRKEFSYPPFTNITRVIIQSPNEENCINYANKIKKELDETTGSQDYRTTYPQAHILGPAPCFFSKLHNKFRYHILIKTSNEIERKKILQNFFKNHHRNGKVEIIMDIDSVNLL